MIRIAIVYHSKTGNTEKMANLVKKGCEEVEGVEAGCFSILEADTDYIAASHAVILGTPTYEGTVSWQMKRFLDNPSIELGGKLGAVFASQNWPGGGGASFAEMTMIAGMLVHGMLIYSGGIAEGKPYLHFGAVSERSPDGLYSERCVKLGNNIARKAAELFGRRPGGSNPE